MNQIYEKINIFLASYKKQIILGAIVFLISSLSFGAGYLANREFNHAPIIIEKCSDIDSLSSTTASTH
jgi:hypothetical protein